MFSEEKLSALIASIGLNNQAFRERERFMDWQPADAASLAQAADSLRQQHSDFIKQLHEHLAHFPDIARQFQQAQSSANLATKQDRSCSRSFR